MTSRKDEARKLMDTDLVERLVAHLIATPSIGTLADRLDYSLNRLGLCVVTEQRLSELTLAARVTRNHNGDK